MGRVPSPGPSPPPLHCPRGLAGQATPTSGGEPMERSMERSPLHSREARGDGQRRPVETRAREQPSCARGQDPGDTLRNPLVVPQALFSAEPLHCPVPAPARTRPRAPERHTTGAQSSNVPALRVRGEDQPMTDDNPIARWVREHLPEVRAWPATPKSRTAPCGVAACSRDAFAVGLCRPHYLRAKRAARSAASAALETSGTVPAEVTPTKKGTTNEKDEESSSGGAPAGPG